MIRNLFMKLKLNHEKKSRTYFKLNIFFRLTYANKFDGKMCKNRQFVLKPKVDK